MTTLNLERISKESGITMEDLQKKSVKTVMKIQENLKKKEEKEKEKERIHDPFYAEMVKKMYNQYDLCRMLFSEKEILKACAKFMGIGDLTEEYIDRYAHDTLQYRTAILKEKKVCKVKRLHGPGSRSGATDNVLCSIFYVPNRYQYIRGGSDVMEYLLEKKFGVKFKVYDLRKEDDYIFAELSQEDKKQRSLYIPYKFLVQKNKEEIEQANLNYWEGYNKTDISDFVYSEHAQKILEKICQ